MINQTLPTGFSAHKQALFGTRLKSAREALGIDRKEIAAQLRLHENMITMIEHGEFKTDIPMTFIRGYIRGYSKLVGIPDKEIHDAMELMKPKPETNEDEISSFATNTSGSDDASIANYFPSIDISNVFMQLFTCLLAITLIGLVAVWWHSHKTPTNKQVTSVNIPAETNTQPVQAPAAAATPQNTAPDYSSLANPESNATAPVPAQTAAIIPVAATPVAKVKAPTVSNQHGKTVFAQLISTNHITRVITTLILLLLIITASMRIYATQTVTGMASLRTNRSTRSVRSAPHFSVNISDVLKGLTTQSSLTILAISTVLICLLGGGWWYKQTRAHVKAPVVKQPIIANTKEQALDPELFNSDFANLKSPATLDTVYMASIKPYALQDLAYQLDQYIADAAATKFALTDKSTPIGQFNRRKFRRHRATYYRNNYRNNVYPAQQEVSNNAPPYYNGQ